MDAIAENRVRPGSILLVENLDRLSREGIDQALEVWRKILRAGVDIAVLKPYPTVYTKESLNDPQGLMMPIMYFHLAYIESKNKSDRISAITQRKRLAATTTPGLRIDGIHPSWLDWDDEAQKFKANEGAEAPSPVSPGRTIGYGGSVMTSDPYHHRYPSKDNDYFERLTGNASRMGNPYRLAFHRYTQEAEDYLENFWSERMARPNR